jgi:hypothetical protein
MRWSFGRRARREFRQPTVIRGMPISLRLARSAAHDLIK